MATYGAWHWTERALTALVRHSPEVHEIIVVDNGSADGTPERLAERFPEVRLIRNAANEGFAAACNQGARVATAPLMCFLNSDAIVEPGWLAPLADAICRRADVGAAVPCLQDLDGRVQCAGALLGRDGTVLEYGNGALVDDPAVAFPRAVTFGPAACLLVDRDAFWAAGGFSRDYDPAYYEDADLCMSLAETGLRTVYVPSSRTRHARYGSGNALRARALSERNRSRFARRWAHVLAGHPASLHPPTQERILAARDADTDGRVLVVASDAPARSTANEEWLLTLSALCPWVRVTLLVAHGAVAPWPPRGIEVLAEPVADVLAARRFHYDAVFAAPGQSLSDALIAETQPQATRAHASVATLELSLASAGILTISADVPADC